MTTETLERLTVGEELAARLRRSILDGDLAPGEPLPEIHLAERFGVSRPSVRDALRLLSHEGLVQHATHRGASVTRLDASEVRDILLVRTIVEPSVVRRFGLPEDLREQMNEVVEQLETVAAAGNWAAYADADIRFHETLVAAAGSPRLAETHSRGMRQLRLHLTFVDRAHEGPGPDRRHVGEHRRMAELLAADRRENAAQLLASHLEDALAALVR